MSTAENNVVQTLPLRNVNALLMATREALARPDTLPGFIVFSGKAGYGKTQAMMKTANEVQGLCINIKSVWTKKHLCETICIELNLPQYKTISQMVDAIGIELMDSERPLFLDDAQYMEKGEMIRIVRDIYNTSQKPIILAGEEKLPSIIAKIDNVDGCTFKRIKAEPCNMADCRLLMSTYAPDVIVEDDLLQRVCDVTDGCCRRVCVNLYHINDFAKKKKLESISLKEYTDDFVAVTTRRRLR